MPSITVVTVILEDREDGGLRVYSDDLPGLILAGPDRTKVAGAIISAIEAIFMHKGFTKVVVRPTRPIGEVLRAESPRDMNVHVHHEQFVVELADAA